MSHITNIHVDNVSRDFKRAAAGWQDGEARYHFWFNIETRQIEGCSFLGEGFPVIFKNSLEMDHRMPGYFNTRKLDATVARNVAIVAEVWTEIERDNLIAKALAERKIEDAALIQKAKESQRQARIADAAPKMHAILVAMHEFLRNGTPVHPGALLMDSDDAIEVVIAKILKATS